MAWMFNWVALWIPAAELERWIMQTWRASWLRDWWSFLMQCTGWPSTSVLSFMLFGVSSTSSTASLPEVGSVRIGGNSHNFLFVCLLIWFVGTESFFCESFALWSIKSNFVCLCVSGCVWAASSSIDFQPFFTCLNLVCGLTFKKNLCVSTTLVFAVELFCPLQSFTNTPIIQVCYTETLQLILSALTKTPSAQ